MNTERFFNGQTEQSRIKSIIVSKYFWAWANVMLSGKKPTPQIGYVDLFSGPGYYADNSLSTPLLVLRKAIDNSRIRNKLVTFFNDINPEYTSKLEAAVEAFEGIRKLTHYPEIRTYEVGTDAISEYLSLFKGTPALYFIDPWGYKGLSLGLLNTVLADWGCDCIFFFNYQRINPALSNPAFRTHMNMLFGEERSTELFNTLGTHEPDERENTIVSAIKEALQEGPAKFVHTYYFKGKDRKRTSHHIVFATKHELGLDIMKGIMAKESSEKEDGVPSFGYSPEQEAQGLLFPQPSPIDELMISLLGCFQGQTLRMFDIYRQHNVGRDYIISNYKEALRRLETKGAITVEPPAATRPVRNGTVTFADDVFVTFP